MIKNVRRTIVLLGLIQLFSSSPPLFAEVSPSSATTSSIDAVLDHLDTRIKSVHGYYHNRNYIRRTAVESVNRQREVFHKPVENAYELRNDLRTELEFETARVVTGKASMDVQLDYGLDPDGDFDTVEESVRLYEAYADVPIRDWSLRVGQQKIRWGKADEINPTDDFTPQDLTEFITQERAERKIPVLAGYLKAPINETFTWEGVWIPFFEESRIAESEDDWEFYFRRNYRKTLGFQSLPESRPDKTFENSVWATRLLSQGGWADWSLSYAYHFEENPTYKVHQDPRIFEGITTVPGTFDTVWEREHTIGADFETARDEWGFRGEAAYITHHPYITYDLADDDLVEFKNTVQSTLGVDYTHSNYYVNVQYTQEFILNHKEEMEPREYESSVAFRAWIKFLHDQLKLEMTGRYFVTDVDYYYKIHATYELRRDLELDTGISVYDGEDIGLLGQFDTNDQVFINTKYYF